MFIFSLLLSGCGDNQEQITPTAYDDKLSKELMTVQGELYLLLEIMGSKKGSQINNQLTQTKSTIKESIQNVEGISGFNKDDGYRETAILLFKTYLNSLNKYYPDVIRLSLLRDPSQAQSDELDTLFEKLEDQEEPVDEKLTEIRKAFCKKHNIEYQEFKND